MEKLKTAKEFNEALTGLVTGMAEAVASGINKANDMRDERIIQWVINNIPGAIKYEKELREYMLGR